MSMYEACLRKTIITQCNPSHVLYVLHKWISCFLLCCSYTTCYATCKHAVVCKNKLTGLNAAIKNSSDRLLNDLHLDADKRLWTALPPVLGAGIQLGSGFGSLGSAAGFTLLCVLWQWTWSPERRGERVIWSHLLTQPPSSWGYN